MSFTSFNLSHDFFALIYLLTTIFFILGLKGLASPKTALKGNRLAMGGMFVAMLITLLHPDVAQFCWIGIGIELGALIGIPLALKIQMTSMPELVAVLHSFVGLAAVFVAIGTHHTHTLGAGVSAVLLGEIGLGSIIGAITFTGSLIAFAKLTGKVGSDPLIFPGQHTLNLLLALGILFFLGNYVLAPSVQILWIVTGLAFLLGFLLVLPIGGADMPVVVSMLNSYSGWAASATGFTLHNPLLIATGALVGSSGAILSYIMVKAMNRSFVSVILGGFGTTQAETDGDSSTVKKNVKSAAVEDAAYLMANSEKVIIVPGYGMAVAQAQHAVKELMQALQQHGAHVSFAIHPVAGRMPGHMNVLLAEADIPYDIVFEMEEINSEFGQTDAVLVIGANDIINPSAKTDKNSPLYGMPILDAYKAKQVFIIKRSMKPGYAGVDNSLFYYDNTSLVFGDAKDICERLSRAIHES